VTPATDLPPSPILSLAECALWRDTLASRGQQVVFTNGCFDLLHAGHVRYLAQARALGDALVVALNSDASVRALKGPTRPVNTEADRAEILLGLRSVNAVIVFSGERCAEEILAIRPHVYAKGGDYTPDSLHPVERAALDAAGTQISILPLVPGRSTTATLQRAATPETRTPSTPRRIRLAVLGSGKGSNFGAILDAIAAQSLVAEVVLVLSDNPNAFILERARQANIPAVFIPPGDAPNALSPAAQKEISDRLRASGCDLVILAGFMKKLKDPVLAAFPERILNIHPSLLPAFPGQEAWKQALAAGASKTGCTVHLVDAGLDTGPILAQQTLPILPTDSASDLESRIREAEHILYPRIIGEYGASLALK
jgi:formyltetrahydrofolate-dependent phosphoribosylglycinamide formyltransferase